jgi:8-oxo-dGTP pyrophosphatase MutT (NUDIX family)
MSGKWTKARMGAGIIPYVTRSGRPYIFMGRRQPGMPFGRLLALPSGCVDIPLGGPENMDEWDTHSDQDFISHDPLQTAMRETSEEAGFEVELKRLEPIIWNRLGYWTKGGMDSYFHSSLYPYKLSTEEIKKILAEENDEMHQWKSYSDREIFLLATKEQIAFPQEFEAIKLLINRLRAERYK